MSAFQLPQGAPLDEDLSTIAGLSPSNDDILQRKAGAWANRTAAQLKTDLALAKGDVGLGNVDNTSDATKNAATATLSNKTVQLAAGTASAGTAPLKFTSGTLNTTAEDGAMEMDDNCLYMTLDAGNRGIIPVIHFIRADSTRTLPNDLNENAIFNSPANGRLTLETGTYMFEALMQVTSMSGTSGNALIDWLGAGTATCAAWMWQYLALDNSAPTTGATNQGAIRVTQDSAASIATAGTGTGLNVWASGTFEVTGAGTLIPSIDQVTAAAAVVGIGSYFQCYRVGSTSVASVGQWD